MVDPETGNPSAFFMRWWQDQVRSNAAIANLSTPEAVSAVLDVLAPGAAQGDVLYRGATLWSRLASSTSGFALKTQGAAADPVWEAVVESITDLADVDTTTAPPTDGQVLAWVDADGEWQPATPAASGAIIINDLTDVDTATAPPTNGQVLTWSSGDSEWQPATPTSGGATVINDLTDVDTATVAPTDGQTLVWSAADSEWQPATPASGGATVINDLTDVDTATAAPTDGQTLVWSAADSEWQPATPAAGSPATQVTVTGVSYTAADSDFAGNKTLLVDNASGCNITVAPSLTNKEDLDIVQIGAGSVVFNAGAGVTIQSADGLLVTRVQFSWAKLTPSISGSDLYYLRGDLKAGAFSLFIPVSADRFVLSDGEIYNVAQGDFVSADLVAADELFSNDLGQVIDSAGEEVYVSPVGLFFAPAGSDGFEFAEGGLLVVGSALLLASNGDTLLTSDLDRLTL